MSQTARQPPLEARRRGCWRATSRRASAASRSTTIRWQSPSPRARVAALALEGAAGRHRHRDVVAVGRVEVAGRREGQQRRAGVRRRARRSRSRSACGRCPSRRGRGWRSPRPTADRAARCETSAVPDGLGREVGLARSGGARRGRGRTARRRAVAGGAAAGESGEHHESRERPRHSPLLIRDGASPRRWPRSGRRSRGDDTPRAGR